MELSDFRIGQVFWIYHQKFKCTDIGTRVVVAIRANIFDEEFDPGPPYASCETVLDENDLPVCTLEERDYDCTI